MSIEATLNGQPVPGTTLLRLPTTEIAGSDRSPSRGSIFTVPTHSESTIGSQDPRQHIRTFAEDDWHRFGIKVQPTPIPERVVSGFLMMEMFGLRPMLVLDPGLSIVELNELFTKDEARLRANEPWTSEWKQQTFGRDEHSDPKWLLIPQNAELPFSRGLDEAEQMQRLRTAQNFRALVPRELIAAMLIVAATKRKGVSLLQGDLYGRCSGRFRPADCCPVIGKNITYDGASGVSILGTEQLQGYTADMTSKTFLAVAFQSQKFLTPQVSSYSDAIVPRQESNHSQQSQQSNQGSRQSSQQSGITVPSLSAPTQISNWAGGDSWVMPTVRDTTASPNTAGVQQQLSSYSRSDSQIPHISSQTSMQNVEFSPGSSTTDTTVQAIPIAAQQVVQQPMQTQMQPVQQQIQPQQIQQIQVQQVQQQQWQPQQQQQQQWQPMQQQQPQMQQPMQQPMQQQPMQQPMQQPQQQMQQPMQQQPMQMQQQQWQPQPQTQFVAQQPMMQGQAMKPPPSYSGSMATNSASGTPPGMHGTQPPSHSGSITSSTHAIPQPTATAAVSSIPNAIIPGTNLTARQINQRFSRTQQRESLHPPFQHNGFKFPAGLNRKVRRKIQFGEEIDIKDFGGVPVGPGDADLPTLGDEKNEDGEGEVNAEGAS